MNTNDPSYASASTGSLKAVACLCARWCRLCGDYEAVFARVAARWPGVAFRWIDIEDEAELVGGVDVETFPTLLFVSAAGPGFFGPLEPREETLQRLLRHHAGLPAEKAAPAAASDPDVAALAARLLREASDADDVQQRLPPLDLDGV